MAGPTPPGQNWWAYPKIGSSIGAALIAGVNAVQQTTLGWQERMVRSATLFGGHGYMSSGRFASTAGTAGLSNGRRSGPRDNIIYSVIDTVCAQLLDDGAPSVSFLTNHGDYELQHKAELLEQFSDGLRYQVGFDAESVRCLFDACIFGITYLKHFVDADNTICNERVFPAEIFVDIWDGRDMRPRTLYQVGFIDRDLLATRYPGKKKDVMGMKPQMPTGFATVTPNNTNVIPFVEGWHLPTSAEEGDGRHVLALANDLVLVNEEWEQARFPFTIMRFQDLPTGFHGMGIAEICQGDQLSLNDANRAEYWAWSQLATPKLFFQTGTLDKNHLNSSMSGVILEGTAPPQVLNFSATHPAFVEWKNDVKAAAFARIGVSQTAAAGNKPIGLNSGEAQRVYADQKKSRFAILNQRWQQFHVDAAKQNIALAGRVYKDEGSYKVKVIGKGFIKELDLKDFHLEEEEYRLQALPVSQLPKSVGGRIQTATELLQASLIDQDTGRKLLQLPDVDEAMSLSNAQLDNAKRTAYLMLHEGVAVQADPMQNLPLCIKVVVAEALKAIDNDAPKEKVDLCRGYLVRAKALLQPAPDPNAAPAPGQAPPGAPPGAPGAGGPPLAVGAQAPQSSVLPFRPPPH